VLGTGTMGGPMARHLASAGHDVRVWNRTREKAEGLGAEVAATPADAVAGAELVLTMLADGPAVDATMREALQALDPGAVWVQASTVGLDWTERLSEEAERRGVLYVDAPVLGTKKPAEEGKLVVVASGPEAARGRAEQAFDTYAARTVWLGDEAGAATRLKLVLNHWIMNAIVNVAETVALAQALGLEPQRFLDAIEGGGMDMPYAHMKTAQILSGDLAPSFALRLARKDVQLILEAAREAGVELGLAPATLERMTRAIDLGHGDEDTAAAYYATRPG
jgi:3-hydroxyisobutyrate dehydrogenase